MPGRHLPWRVRIRRWPICSRMVCWPSSLLEGSQRQSEPGVRVEQVVVISPGGFATLRLPGLPQVTVHVAITLEGSQRGLGDHGADDVGASSSTLEGSQPVTLAPVGHRALRRHHP